MRILAIETSCDETAVAVIEGNGDESGASFTVLGNALLSQAVHAEFGGVFPALAKREHAKNLVPLVEACLEEAELLGESEQLLTPEVRDDIAKLLEREPGLPEAFFEFIGECEPPAIDAIAVTAGPGLEPALWVGINFARALARTWDKPVVAVNHMEGHVLSGLSEVAGEKLSISSTRFPVLALLISGGHTELVLMPSWLSYELMGQTRDDAVGEAFDKVARMLSLPYPGGPEISKLAEAARVNEEAGRPFTLPRPMIDSNTCDFSFAGLKTAVLYLLKEKPSLTEQEKGELALEFENAVTAVLWHKTRRAIKDTGAKRLVLGGGVSANTHIRRTFTQSVQKEFPGVSLCIPRAELTTDNAVMIGLAGYFRALKKEFATEIAANGNLSLATK